MNTTEKKFLFPVLYPLNRDITKTWFIKYRFEDFTTGTFKAGKYYGEINLHPTAEARTALAAQYMQMMHTGEPLPSYQGMKRLTAAPVKNFANASRCCLQYVADRRNELHPRTVSQYNSRINLFSRWLQINNLQHLSIGGITRDHARAFLNYLLEDKKYSAKTYNDYKTLLGTVWQQYVDDLKIKSNPWRKINCQPDHPTHIASYPPALRELIKQHLPQYDPQLWLFMQCIYYCAIRPGCELRLMKVKNYLHHSQMFYVPKEIAKGPKGKKQAREINIYTGLHLQLTAAGYQHYPADWFLFSAEGKPGAVPVPVNYFRNRWNEFKKLHSIPAQYKLYGSKHTGGKEISKKFGDYITKEHFGHSTIESTKQYTEGLSKNELQFLQTQLTEF